jgi:hypothetical protein
MADLQAVIEKLDEAQNACGEINILSTNRTAQIDEAIGVIEEAKNMLRALPESPIVKAMKENPSGNPHKISLGLRYGDKGMSWYNNRWIIWDRNSPLPDTYEDNDFAAVTALLKEGE